MLNDQNDSRMIELHDIWVALSLLSRLPVPVDHDRAGARAAQASWAYPIAGAILGLIAGFVGWGLMALGLSASIGAGIALLTLVVISGALHEDGLADCADGLWGGNTPERRLEIMKDSRIGVYGTIALILFIGLRWQSLGALTAAMLIPAMVVSGTVSRAVLPWIMTRFENARGKGLSHSVGRPNIEIALLGTLATFGIVLLTAGLTGIIAMIAAYLVAILLICYVQTKIAGQTGDILGGIQQFVETTTLILLVALM